VPRDVHGKEDHSIEERYKHEEDSRIAVEQDEQSRIGTCYDLKILICDVL
jgi:hypothetical protein